MGKGRKLHIADYLIKAKDTEGEEKEAPYSVRLSLVNLLFHPKTNLDAFSALKCDIVARQIEACKEDYILLTEEQYNWVKDSVNSFRGFDRYAVELINRVHNAPEIDIEITEVK